MPARGELQAIGGRSSDEQMKCPTQFMFIDSSNGGVNAKPDKVVRSFVMKSARNKKSWSTRPKSPKMEQPSEKKQRRRSSSRKYSVMEPSSSSDGLTRLKCTTSPVPWDNRSPASPHSSRSDSIFSCHSGIWTCESPLSSLTSPSLEYESGEDVFNFSKPRQIKSPRQETFDARALHPFDCLVVTLDTKAQRLLHQFVEAASTRLIPIDLYRSSEKTALAWATACIQSPIGSPFIYAALTSSSRAAQLDSEAYKWRAMSEVNALLANPRTSTSDVTIAAVLMLLAIEEADLADPKRKGDDRRCSMSVNEAHHNGLRTMLRQRGGLAALSGNRCLQVCLLMHSIAQSITTFRQPYAVLVDANGHIEDYTVSTNQSPRAFTNVLQAFRELGVARSLLKILFAVTAFTTDLESWYEVGTCTIDALDLQKHASLLMYRLLDWYQNNDHERTDELSPMDSVNQSVCLATLIFLVNATEPNAAAFGPRLSKAVIKLRQSLERAPSLQWSKAPSILFWVLTMGALGTSSLKKGHRRPRSEPELVFFEQYIKSVFAGNCLDQPISVEQILDGMRTCLWIPSIFDERVKSLWMYLELYESWPLESEDANCSEGEQTVEEEYALGKSTTLRFFTMDTSVSGRPSLSR